MEIILIELQSDLFIIPTSDDRSIVYSPLRGIAFTANSRATNIIREYVNSGEIPKENQYNQVYEHLEKISQLCVDPPKIDTLHNRATNAVFILSQLCNLDCSYCYAKDYRSSGVLSFEKITAVVDYVFSETQNKIKTFSFIGGGEPLFTWELFNQAVIYIREKSEKMGIENNIGVATNGTLLNEERIKFLKDNNISVSISFDILPEIQDVQRPYPGGINSSFKVVDKNIKLLIAHGIIPRIRTTITKTSVNKMAEMVSFVAENYPEIKSVQLEPVTDIEDNDDDFFNSYTENFFKAKNISKKHGLFIKNSITHSFNRLRTRFCNGEFCITPESKIVACHRISSSLADHFDKLVYGQINDDNQIIIDELSEKGVLEYFERKRFECSTCFARWHCAGGCPMFKLTTSKKPQDAYCKFVQNTVKILLEEKLSE